MTMRCENSPLLLLLSRSATMPPSIILPGSATTRPIAKHLKSSITNAEALSLYREILRTAKAFHWCDENGTPWRNKLRAEARKEFESSREEKDPLLIARMIVTGRECVREVQMKFNEADRKCWERIQQDSIDRGGGGGGGGGEGSGGGQGGEGRGRNR